RPDGAVAVGRDETRLAKPHAAEEGPEADWTEKLGRTIRRGILACRPLRSRWSVWIRRLRAEMTKQRFVANRLGRGRRQSSGLPSYELVDCHGDSACAGPPHSRHVFVWSQIGRHCPRDDLLRADRIR